MVSPWVTHSENITTKRANKYKFQAHHIHLVLEIRLLQSSSLKFQGNIIWQENYLKCVLYWYHSYINHPCVGRLSKKIQKALYCKLLFNKAEMLVNILDIFHQFKNKKRLYWHMTPKIISGIKMWNLVNVYLIGIYVNSVIQQHTGNYIILKYLTLSK